jgi:hypothetical protein
MVVVRERQRACWRLLIALILAVFAGCGGDPKYPVTGKVTLPDGRPFVGAVVEFAAVEGIHSAAGLVQDDGTYVLTSEHEGDGAPPGAYRVRVIPPEEDETGNADDDDPYYRRRKRSPLPPRYIGFDTSGLEFTVSDSGENNFDIAIKNK